MLSKTWTPLQEHIQQLRDELSLSPTEFAPVNIHAWQDIQRKIEDTFVGRVHYRQKFRWYWEDFTCDMYSIAFKQDPYQLLHLLIDSGEQLWFFVNETVEEQTKFWFYEGKIRAIQRVIGEAIGLSEYYICSQKYEWMLCVNHHDYLVGTGLSMPQRLKNFDEELLSTKPELLR